MCAYAREKDEERERERERGRGRGRERERERERERDPGFVFVTPGALVERLRRILDVCLAVKPRKLLAKHSPHPAHTYIHTYM